MCIFLITWPEYLFQETQQQIFECERIRRACFCNFEWSQVFGKVLHLAPNGSRLTLFHRHHKNYKQKWAKWNIGRINVYINQHCSPTIHLANFVQNLCTCIQVVNVFVLWVYGSILFDANHFV